MGALGYLHAVEHHHRQAHVIEPAARQLRKRGLRALDERLRDRGLRRSRGLLLDLLADRLADARELAGRDSGEHPVKHRSGQRIAVSESS